MVGQTVYVIGGRSNSGLPEHASDESYQSALQRIGMSRIACFRFHVRFLIRDVYLADAYSFETDLWSRIAPRPTVRGERLRGAIELNGTLVTISSGSNCCGPIQSYSAATDRWTLLSDARLPADRTIYGYTVAAYSGCVMIVGGSDNERYGYCGNSVYGMKLNPPASVETGGEYDSPAPSGAWATFPPFRIKRESPLVVVWQHKLVVIGGDSMNESLRSVEMFDPNSGLWSFLPSLSYLPICCAGVVGNRMYILPSGEAYDEVSNRWVLSTMNRNDMDPHELWFGPNTVIVN
jgi:hypothetical protein